MSSYLGYEIENTAGTDVDADAFPIRLEDVRRLDVRPGDKILVTVNPDRHYTMEQYQRILEQLNGFFGGDVRVLLVEGLDLAVVPGG